MQNQSEVTRATRAIAQRLTEWRKANHAPTPIPESIWTGAATLARTHGVAKISRALKLDYATLKRRLGQGPIAPRNASPTAESTFLEWLSPAATNSIAECVVELEASRGRLRLEMKNVPAAGLAALVRELAG